MTTIGFRTTEQAPRELPRVVPGGRVQEQSRSGPRLEGWTRVGPVQLRSALRYLFVWSLALCAVLVVVLVVGYALLTLAGVTGSVSKALGILSGDEVTSSGLVPALQPQRVLPVLLVTSAVLSALAFIAALAAVLVHNAATSLTGGLRVRMRPDAVRPVRPRPRDLPHQVSQ